MLRTLSIIALVAGSFAMTAQAQVDVQVDEDEIVRLPGQGEVRDKRVKDKARADRLKPGGGLFITFDQDEDGRISSSEIDSGIPVAFQAADKNQDGHLTALEQQDWAASLPTRDDSLANPFRFDPNLDRRVDLDEFTLVINNLGLDYADEASGDIIIADLKAPRPRRQGRGNEADEILRRDREQRERGDRNRSSVR